MKREYNPAIHRRRSSRLRGYDYSSAGAYFVTICTKQRECLFREIVDGIMRPREAGKVFQLVWDTLPRHYANVDLDIFVIMPNHIHGIIVMTDTSVVGAGAQRPHQIWDIIERDSPVLLRFSKIISDCVPTSFRRTPESRRIWVPANAGTTGMCHSERTLEKCYKRPGRGYS